MSTKKQTQSYRTKAIIALAVVTLKNQCNSATAESAQEDIAVMHPKLGEKWISRWKGNWPENEY